MNPPDSDLSQNVQRLRRLDACAVSDALDKLQLRGTVSGLRQLSSSRRIAGRVTTVKLVRHAEAEAVRQGPPRHLCTTAIEASGPDHVIVVEQRTGLDAGSWGGILTLSAKLRGVAGVIAEGPVRDIDEARHCDFPVFARGLTAITARGRVAEIGTQVEIQVGDITVQADDYVIADNSGVVFIDAAQIERVLDAAEQIVAREAAMAKALLNGQPASQVMGANYEHMLTN
jgi:regulator of RNase E activity RraA